jgi:uncharacterized protein (DUF2147 family)
LYGPARGGRRFAIVNVWRSHNEKDFLPMTLRRSAIAAVMFGVCLTPAFAADPNGTWLTEGGSATVRMASCGAELCGTIIALKEPNDPATGRPKTDKHNPDASKRDRPVVGVQIVFGMKPSGTTDKWNGQVYNAEDGKTYTGSITMQGARTLKLEGCVLGGLICKTQTWTKSS